MKIKDYEKLINKLINFQQDATLTDFEMAFGPTIGAHLWDKFNYKYHHNILVLFNVLDRDRRTQFIMYVNRWRENP